MTVRPAKTRISLSIRPIWSESSLCAQRVAKDPSFHHADSEDSDQTGRMPRLIWLFAGRTCHFVGFDMRRLKRKIIKNVPKGRLSHTGLQNISGVRWKLGIFWKRRLRMERHTDAWHKLCEYQHKTDSKLVLCCYSRNGSLIRQSFAMKDILENKTHPNSYVAQVRISNNDNSWVTENRHDIRRKEAGNFVFLDTVSTQFLVNDCHLNVSPVTILILRKYAIFLPKFGNKQWLRFFSIVEGLKPTVDIEN